MAKAAATTHQPVTGDALQEIVNNSRLRLDQIDVHLGDLCLRGIVRAVGCCGVGAPCQCLAKRHEDLDGLVCRHADSDAGLGGAAAVLVDQIDAEPGGAWDVSKVWEGGPHGSNGQQ